VGEIFFRSQLHFWRYQKRITNAMLAQSGMSKRVNARRNETDILKGTMMKNYDGQWALTMVLPPVQHGNNPPTAVAFSFDMTINDGSVTVTTQDGSTYLGAATFSEGDKVSFAITNVGDSGPEPKSVTAFYGNDIADTLVGTFAGASAAVAGCAEERQSSITNGTWSAVRYVQPAQPACHDDSSTKTVVGAPTPFHSLTPSDSQEFNRALPGGNTKYVNYSPYAVSTQLVNGMIYRFKCTAQGIYFPLRWNAMVEFLQPTGNPPPAPVDLKITNG
jgi:hypothetical protein